MADYKVFSIGSNAKLRIRTDSIVATVSSKTSGTMNIYCAHVANPWHINCENNENVDKMIDYIWKDAYIAVEGEDE